MSLDVLHGKSSSVDGGQKHPSLNKPEHRNSKASRRGPMDDMRQLVRILVKIFPQSTQYLQMGEEGGGNRVSEPQIKEYLRRTLGSECPQPEWGLPQGWGEYIASKSADLHACMLAGTARCMPCTPRLCVQMTVFADDMRSYTTCKLDHTGSLARSTVQLGPWKACLTRSSHEVCAAAARPQLGGGRV